MPALAVSAPPAVAQARLTDRGGPSDSERRSVHFWPSWSPDGRRIAVVRADLENEEETAGVVCIAAPVRAASAAAVGVTALAAQLRERSVKVVSARVREAADSLSLLVLERVPLAVRS